MPSRFSEIFSQIYRSGAPSVNELPILKNVWGIQKIVSLDSGVAKEIHEACKSLGLRHQVFPIESSNIDEALQILPQVLESFLEGGPSLIHCYHGKDRTGLVAALIRIQAGWPLQDALKEALSFGFGKGLSKNIVNKYLQTMKDFEKNIHSKDNILQDFNDAMAYVGQYEGSDYYSRHLGILEPLGSYQYSTWPYNGSFI